MSTPIRWPAWSSRPSLTGDLRDAHRHADPAHARRHAPDADARDLDSARGMRRTARTRSPAATTDCRSRWSRCSACSVSICGARPRTSIRWSCCSSGFSIALEHGAFAVRPLARRYPPEPGAHAGDRHAGVVAAGRVYAISAAMAGTAGALSAQTTRFVGLEHARHVLISGIAVVMLVLGGTQRLYGAFSARRSTSWSRTIAAKINPVLLDVRHRWPAHGDRAVPGRRPDGSAGHRAAKCPSVVADGQTP